MRIEEQLAVQDFRITPEPRLPHLITNYADWIARRVFNILFRHHASNRLLALEAFESIARSPSRQISGPTRHRSPN